MTPIKINNQADIELALKAIRMFLETQLFFNRQSTIEEATVVRSVSMEGVGTVAKSASKEIVIKSGSSYPYIGEDDSNE